MTFVAHCNYCCQELEPVRKCACESRKFFERYGYWGESWYTRFWKGFKHS